jgi:hypothetical protein
VGTAGIVLEFLGKYLMAPPRKGGGILGGNIASKIITGEGELWVSAAALTEERAWHSVMALDIKVPSATAAGRVLHQLATDRVRVQVDGDRLWFWRVRVDSLYAWVEESQFGDLDALKAKINAPNNTIATTGRKPPTLSIVPPQEA